MHIHFVHVRGSGRRPLPLPLTHGWPGSSRRRLSQMRSDAPISPAVTNEVQKWGEIVKSANVKVE